MTWNYDLSQNSLKLRIKIVTPWFMKTMISNNMCFFIFQYYGTVSQQSTSSAWVWLAVIKYIHNYTFNVVDALSRTPIHQLYTHFQRERINNRPTLLLVYSTEDRQVLPWYFPIVLNIDVGLRFEFHTLYILIFLIYNNWIYLVFWNYALHLCQRHNIGDLW